MAKEGKILVIDDHPGVRDTICSMLRRGGYEPVEATNGLDGVKALMKGRFALVVTDLLMPEQEGIETIRQIREVDPDMPIIAISGWDTEDFSPLEDAVAMGANRRLTKPFRFEELLKAVRELLES